MGEYGVEGRDDGHVEARQQLKDVGTGVTAEKLNTLVDGATILTECAVRSLDLQAGRVAGVVTERGRIACESVVLAGGAWSRLFCGNAGVDLPQLKVLASVYPLDDLRMDQSPLPA